MKKNTAPDELEARAMEALTGLLRQMHGVSLREMQRMPAGESRNAGILARIDVFGHSHNLICALESDGEPTHVRAVLCRFQEYATPLTGSAIPALIAPRLSPEAQALCTEARVGFLDLEGNARLFAGELFIAMRALSRHAFSRSSAALRIKNGIKIVHAGGRPEDQQRFTAPFTPKAPLQHASLGGGRSAPESLELAGGL